MSERVAVLSDEVEVAPAGKDVLTTIKRQHKKEKETYASLSY